MFLEGGNPTLHFSPHYLGSLAAVAAFAALIQIVVAAKFGSRSWLDDIVCVVAIAVITTVFGLWVGTVGATIAAMLGSVTGLWLAVVYGMLRACGFENWLRDELGPHFAGMDLAIGQ